MKLLAAIALNLFVATALAQADGPVPVRVAEARLLTMAPTTTVPGTVISRHDARIAAEVDGVLRQVADFGARLKAGDPLAVIEDTQLLLRQTELQAQVSREVARLDFLTKEERRLSQLIERNIAARTQLDQIRSDRDVARGDLAVARARLAQVEDLLKRTTISAPFDAVVAERLGRPGERVSVGMPVVRLVDPDHLEVIARAPLEVMPYLPVGSRLSVRTARQEKTGIVRSVVAIGDENTHLFETRIDLEGAAFPIGQTVRLTLPASDSRKVLAVPRDALVLRADSVSVFVVDTEGSVSRVTVEPGLADGDWIEVYGEIEAGDRVVIRGNERLRAGQQVSIQADS